MNKNTFKILAAFTFIMICSTTQASVIPDEGTVTEWLLPAQSYNLPYGYSCIGSESVDLNHYYAYTWVLNDLNSIGNDATLEIVFHGIYNWVDYEDNILNVYIKDGVDSGNDGYDARLSTYPDWSGWTHIGAWIYEDTDNTNVYPDASYDVAFILNMNPEWVSYLTNGNGFTVGFDPDCHFYGDRVDVNAPVPEPATLVLLGSGLLGLAGFRRKIR